MNIHSFGEFISEDIKISVVDVVIDNDGVIYNGEFDGVPVLKGTIQQKKISGKNEIVAIIGDDGRSYPAGIDKNGVMVCVSSKNGDVLKEDGTRLLIPEEVKERYPKKFRTVAYRTNFDYSFVLSLLPTGWVNVKIDMEILKRVRRYSKNLGDAATPHEALKEKLAYLQKISKARRKKEPKKQRENIQKELSVIMLLHYIKEIKNFFTPSSSGFLFESFIAGLIPGSKVKEDNSIKDIVSGNEAYQIKLYGETSSSIPIAPDSGELDYYIICLKYPERIDVYILSTDPGAKNYYGDFASFTIDEGTGKKKKNKGSLSVSKMVTFAQNYKYSLEIINIEQKINRIAEGLKEVLDGLYDELSMFQYNVETIITGVDQKGDLIDEETFEMKSEDAKDNIKNMSDQLKALVKTIRAED